HDEARVVTRRVEKERDGLEEAVRARAVRLSCRAAVEVPQRQLVESRLRLEVDDLRLAAQVRNGLVTVEPDVLELELHMVPPLSRTNKKRPRTPRVLRPHCLGGRLRRRAPVQNLADGTDGV